MPASALPRTISREGTTILIRDVTMTGPSVNAIRLAAAEVCTSESGNASGTTPIPTVAGGTTRKHRKPMSAAARERIAAAQRKRHAQGRKQPGKANQQQPKTMTAGQGNG